MTLSEFTQLKNGVVRTVVTSDRHSNLLHSLKELFREDINSVRRFEKICTIGQLLNVLELRGVLSEDNVEPLKHIARKINSNELLVKVNQYEDSHVPREHGNFYGKLFHNQIIRYLVIDLGKYGNSHKVKLYIVTSYFIISFM